MNIQAIAQNYNDYLIEMRRWFYQHPEIAEKEFETSATIKEELDKYGISWRPCGLQTGVLATIEGGKPGAPGMIADGALEGVDSAFAVHIMSMIPAGQVSINCGPQMAGVDKFVISIEGKGGHASSPHECIDPVVCMGAMIGNLQTVVSRQCSPMESAVLTIGKAEAGTLWNIIPGTASLEGTTRYFTREMYQRFPEMMEHVVKYTGETYRCNTGGREHGKKQSRNYAGKASAE